MTTETTTPEAKTISKQNEEEKPTPKEKVTQQTSTATTNATQKNLAGALGDQNPDTQAQAPSGTSASIQNSGTGGKQENASAITPSEAPQAKGSTPGKNGEQNSSTPTESSSQPAEGLDETTTTKKVTQKANAISNKDNAQDKVKNNTKLSQGDQEPEASHPTVTTPTEKGDKDITVRSSEEKKPSSKTEVPKKEEKIVPFVQKKQPPKEKKGFFGTIGNGIKKIFTGIGKGVKKGVQGLGNGIGKVSNRLTRKFQSNATADKYSDWREFFEVFFVKGPTTIARKILLEPATLPLAGIGSLLSRDGSYLKNAWKRWMGSMDPLKEAKDKPKKVEAVEEAVAAADDKEIASSNTTTSSSNPKEAVSKAEITEKKEGKVVKFTPKQTEAKTIQEISVGDKFNFDHDGSPVLTYEIKDIKDNLVSFVDHDSSDPKAIQTATKEEFLKKVGSTKYSKVKKSDTSNTEVKKAA